MSAPNAPQVFEVHARSYDAQRRRLVPPFDGFYGTAVASVALVGRQPARILDLGAGTGLLAAELASAYPGAELLLLDGAAAMLDEAEARLGERACYVQADLSDPLPSGPWDAVVSALAIHHLEDSGKRALFARVHAALAPGGVFVNAEQVMAPTAFFDQLYARHHAASARAAGVSPEDWEAAEERMSLDRCASAEHQLHWLREAGFTDADCLFKHYNFAVLVARAAA